MKWPNRAEILFSVKSFAAAMLALYIAMRIGLPRPFWAPLTAYVVSNPLAAASRSKAIYRVLGTILGSVFTLFAVPHLINYSVLLTLAMAAWLAVCIYLSFQDRSPRSYIFILAAYTPCFIGLPTIMNVSDFNQTTMFYAAIYRIEEILLGISCAYLIHSVFFPQSIGPMILSRLDQALDDAQTWLRHALLGEDASQNSIDHRKLAQDTSELRLMSTHVPFDTSNLRWTSNAIRVMQDRLASLVPFMTAVEDRVKQLRKMGNGKLPAHWENLLAHVVTWTAQKTDATPESAIQLRRRIREATPVVDAQSSWHHMVEVNLAAHLNRLVDAFENAFHQRRQIGEAVEGKKPIDPYKTKRIPTRKLHVDHQLGAFSGFAAALTFCLGCIFWVWSGWPLGFAAPMMGALYCTFFASLDNPVPALKISFIYTLYSSISSGIYMLWLLPSAHSMEMVILVFAPFFLVGGIYLARPTTVIKAVPFVLTTLATLTMFDMGSADMTSFINSQVSQAVGIGFAIFSMSLMRSLSGRWTGQRLLRASWQEIIQLAQAIKTPALTAVTIRMVDRVAQLSPRLVAFQEDREKTAATALIDLRVGVNMAYLLRVRNRLARNSISIEGFLKRIADYFKRRETAEKNCDAELLEQIDLTLNKISLTEPFPMRNEALASLVGIRRDLYPQAAPYQPQRSNLTQQSRHGKEQG